MDLNRYKKWIIGSLSGVGMTVLGFVGEWSLGEWRDYQNLKGAWELHVKELKEVKFSQIQYNHQELEDVEEVNAHLMEDVHALQSEMMMVRRDVDRIHDNQGFGFNRLEEVEEIQRAAVSRDSNRRVKPIER